MQTKFKIDFTYDDRGYGNLLVYEDNKLIFSYYARTGSCNKRGILINAIDPHPWYILTGPVDPADSEYFKMYIPSEKGIGWKIRLFPIAVPPDHFIPTNYPYLIHPDGNLPGTKGCIGIQKSNATELLKFFHKFFYDYKHEIIILTISRKKDKQMAQLKEYKKLKTGKKITGMFIVVGMLNGLLTKFLPVVPEFIGEITNIDPVIILPPAITGIVVWVKDVLKHKLGINLPF